MPADPHDLGSDHELILKFQRTRRNGTTGSLTSLVGGEAIYADTINIAKAADRARFVSDLMAKCPSIDRDDAEQQLLIIVARLACETDGTDDRDESATDEGASYDVVDGRLSRVIGKGSEGGDRISIPLCKFAAKIVEVVVRYDGIEQSCRLAIEGTLATGEPLPRIEISPEELTRSDWPLTRWETCATVYVGPYFRDHLRAGLQLHSGRVPRRDVFTCTGWQQIGGMWAFLHDLGAIGPFGPMKRISVDLPDALKNFRFPDPPEGEALKEAVKASLDLLRELAPDKVIFPLLATVYRSVLPGVDYSAHLAGRTGVFKSELTALAQQHFGAGMDARALPASWSSTGNALEGIAFAARDALLVVDDFAPSGSTTDVNRYHREADRLLRAQGNRSGRQRLRPDGTPKPARPPRGTILSTGEDIPKGHSLQARLLVVEVGRKDVRADRLTECQRAAAAGCYVAAMAACVQWLAVQYEQTCIDLKSEAERLRAEIGTSEVGSDRHRRTPAMVADLLAGFALFLRFAQECGALDVTAARFLEGRCRVALLEVADEQAAHQEASDPCDRFLSLLRSVLSQGRAHVTDLRGGRPEASPRRADGVPRVARSTPGWPGSPRAGSSDGSRGIACTSTP